MPEPITVQPRDMAPEPPATSAAPETPTTPGQEAPAPTATSEAPSQTLPPELIHIPVFNALMTGNPAAVSVDLKTFAEEPEAKVIVDNADLLKSAGFDFYKSLNNENLGAIYNTLYLNGQELINADRRGKLQVIAPPFDVVTKAIQQSGMTNPVLRHKDVPSGPKAAPPHVPPQLGSIPQSQSPTPAPASSGPKPATASEQARVMGQRTKNLTPGGPLTGESPGGGRLLNNILRPVV